MTPTSLRILMLHGYTQSGPLFRLKTRALEKQLQKAFPPPTYTVSLFYPTAPIKIHASDIPNFSPSSTSATRDAKEGVGAHESERKDDTDAWGWWVRKGTQEPHFTYHGIELGLSQVAEVLERDGPFDGVIGFSQGGAMAGMVASLLEGSRRASWTSLQKRQTGDPMMPFPESFLRPGHSTGYVEDDPVPVHPPLRFAVSYSGFGATNEIYKGFYDPKIETPMLHFIGSVDTVVEEERSLALVRSCVEGEGTAGRRVVRHPGGHFLPSQKQYVAALVEFIREVMGWDGLESHNGVSAAKGTNGTKKSTTSMFDKRKDEDDLDEFPF